MEELGITKPDNTLIKQKMPLIINTFQSKEEIYNEILAPSIYSKFSN